MIDTNIKGLLYVSRKVLPWRVERKQGHVFNIASIAGKETYLNGNVYCATKTAVDSLSRAMRMDMVPDGINVTNVAPGAVETEFSIVRFKGDQQRADNVYKGYEPLTGQDIANTIYYVATLPDHVCINDLLITPKAQASASIFHKE
jgi:NADP-dependent 3-hydroxy acid dehydrogenase YdfG